MKKTLTSVLIIAGMLLAVNMQPVKAQSNEDDSEEGQIQLGGGLAFGSEIEKLGIRIDGTYGINEQIRGAANFTYYFPDDVPNGNVTWTELNFNGHYTFDVDADFEVYGLGGINIVFYSTPQYTNPITGNQFGGTQSEFGLNLGGGIQYPVDFGNLFGEMKYTISDFDQLAITAGVRFPIGG